MLYEVITTDNDINAWLYIDESFALDNAEKVQAEIDTLLKQGKKLPPLAGVPFGINVITSYSIHYTKLYDTRSPIPSVEYSRYRTKWTK